jgi:pimeloyl-ACP methyl ester carboxylesterase
MLNDIEIRNRAGERLDHTFHPGGRPDALVVIGHGVTGNKDRPHLVALADGLSERGWPCLRVSFSGNGASEGRFEDSTITKEIGDLQAVLDLVPDDAAVIYIGHSMGGAVGVLTAARDLRIRALVSLAGMTHTAEFCDREFGGEIPGAGFMWDEPDCPYSVAFADDMHQIGSTLDAAAAVTQPWLLIHGTADDVVPPRDGRDARDAADCEKKWVEIEGAGHSFEGFHPALVDTVGGWLDEFRTRHCPR